MKTVSISDELHEWIMDHKNNERSSAEKVILALIGKKDRLIPNSEGYDKLGVVAAGKGAVVVHITNKRVFDKHTVNLASDGVISIEERRK